MFSTSQTIIPSVHYTHTEPVIHTKPAAATAQPVAATAQPIAAAMETAIVFPAGHVDSMVAAMLVFTYCTSAGVKASMVPYIGGETPKGQVIRVGRVDFPGPVAAAFDQTFGTSITLATWKSLFATEPPACIQSVDRFTTAKAGVHDWDMLLREVLLDIAKETDATVAIRRMWSTFALYNFRLPTFYSADIEARLKEKLEQITSVPLKTLVLDEATCRKWGMPSALQGKKCIVMNTTGVKGFDTNLAALVSLGGAGGEEVMVNYHVNHDRRGQAYYNLHLRTTDNTVDFTEIKGAKGLPFSAAVSYRASASAPVPFAF